MSHSDSRHQLFETARRQVRWTLEELWVSYLAYGGTLVVFDLDAYLHGFVPIPAEEQEVLACVLNERFADLGQHTRLPYLFDQPIASSSEDDDPQADY